MLDTLQTSSLYAITGTCFALMAPALNEVMAPTLSTDPTQSTAVTVSSLAIAGALNAGVVIAFCYAMLCEGKRLIMDRLDKDGKGHVTMADVRSFVMGAVPRRVLQAASSFGKSRRFGSGSKHAKKDDGADIQDDDAVSRRVKKEGVGQMKGAVVMFKDIEGGRYE